MTSSQATRIRSVIQVREKGISSHLGSAAQVEYLQESFRQMANEILKFEDQFWNPILGMQNEAKGFTLEEIQNLAEYAERQVKSNALLGRGLRLKTNHVIGRGFRFESTDRDEIQARFLKIINDPDNQEVLFGPAALKKNQRILFNSGNLMVIWNDRTKKASRMPIDLQVSNFIAYSDDPERVKYYQRTYTDTDDFTGKSIEVNEWIPVSTYKDSLKSIKKKLPRSLPGGAGQAAPPIPVNQDCVVIDLRVNNDSGEVWGVPDCLSALPWAWAAGEYLRDGSKMLKALSTIAYQVKAKTQAGQKTAGAQVSRSRVAGTAITGPETEISQIPRANAVDLYTGRPLQAQVASALDVSVTSLTGDTAKGGSNGAESTLSLPEQLAALSRQEDFSGFYARIFRAMGAENIRINFNRLAVDPIHRQAQTAGLFRDKGGISQEEFREIALELLDISGKASELPEPDAWTGSKFGSLEEWVRKLAKTADAEDKALDKANDQAIDDNARQGNSGSVGSLTDDNELRDTDKAAS